MHIVVESDLDAALYNRLAGPSLGRWLEFISPANNPAGAQRGGYLAAHEDCEAARAREANQVPTDRLPRTFCLLDGEERVRFGLGPDFRDEVQFTMPEEPQVIYTVISSDAFATHPGVLFLNCFEKESLYLLHSDAIEVMKDSWSEDKTLFGESGGWSSSWIVLQRALVAAQITISAKKYGFEGPRVGELIGLTYDREKRTDVLSEAFLSLCQDLSQKIGAEGHKTIKNNIDRIMRSGPAFLAFEAAELRACDANVFLKLGFEQRCETWYPHFEDSMLRSNFPVEFQMSLMFSLTREARHVRAVQRRGSYSTPEVKFGRGRNALIASPQSPRSCRSPVHNQKGRIPGFGPSSGLS
ncbi:hypothetical protein [Methylobacterium symbioticum]|uniref:hypothetical protein n=1 Tax=Methylobacterium symbioticum TaxID=2584084 RepID=UPI001158623F|nr:hypothetical protein [Methylobacterium symbioticum]